jgi:tripartite-type tricarboxylate transporter receptor subunit TctC
MFAAPSGTPQPILEKLSADLRSVLDMPDIAKSISQNGMLPLPPSNIADLQTFVKAEIKRWSEIVRKAGIEGSQ